MNIRRVTYFTLGVSIFAASCTKEAAEPDIYDWNVGEIYFKTSLAAVEGSRGQDMTLDALETFQVTCFNTADTDKDSDGNLIPYFENATFIRKQGSQIPTFESSPAEGPRDWPANSGQLRFFAFSPSLAAMGGCRLINTTSGNGTTATVGYRLSDIRINRDISRQYDFITAEASGERWKDFTGGVELDFRHQLSQVELRAWGGGTDYDFEIAGVRIGNPVVEGSFVMAEDDDPANAKKWERSDKPVKDKVEYLYRGNDDPGSGDTTYKINGREHRTQESASSIMGKGGSAMVIPTFNTRWEGAEDPNLGSESYRTDRMYFSVLLRATDSTTGDPVYPYPGNPYGMTVEYYAVDRSGNIISRVYAGEAEGDFFTDPDLKNVYVADDGEEIKDFGWAAVPVDADWSAGKKYIYTLNYSEGIGLHDPEDPEPGRPIGQKSSISWEVSVSSWDPAKPDDNYTPDLNVPGTK